ncbi:MAG: shikimate dehydrogenase [Clostridia bacterium]|nr:shikimate dehydrogenase [Clostridia bacterium]
MEFGCIAEHLPHSFSKIIHAKIASYAYDLVELTPDQVGPFLQKADCLGINVTIPYKKTVMPYLYQIDPGAEAIGAVNTIVKRDGKLYGYNTDFGGMLALIHRMGWQVKGKKVLVLGTGGTGRTAVAVASHLGAGVLKQVSRTGKDGAITYQEMEEGHTDADYIINTTPCGMFPKSEAWPVEPSHFPRLAGLLDAIYNPLSTHLVEKARAAGAVAEGGLYMLVAQAVLASEHFLDTRYPADLIERVYEDVLREKQNIVLIGMPSSGKTTVGHALAETLGRPLFDSDEELVKRAGMPIPDFFAKYGEPAFRDLEAQVIADLSAQNGAIIATGGGTVLREENVAHLKQNGVLFFLDRGLAALTPTDDRPLSNSEEKLKAMYQTRLPIYRAAADHHVKEPASPEAAVASILKFMRFDV